MEISNPPVGRLVRKTISSAELQEFIASKQSCLSFPDGKEEALEEVMRYIPNTLRCESDKYTNSQTNAVARVQEIILETSELTRTAQGLVEECLPSKLKPTIEHLNNAVKSLYKELFLVAESHRGFNDDGLMLVPETTTPVTTAEFCHVVDTLTSKQLKQMEQDVITSEMKSVNEEEDEEKRETLTKLMSLTVNVVILLHMIEEATEDDMATSEGHAQWRDRVWVITSFATLLTALEMRIQKLTGEYDFDE